MTTQNKVSLFPSGFAALAGESSVQKLDQNSIGKMRFDLAQLQGTQASNHPINIGANFVLQIVGLGPGPSDDKGLMANRHPKTKGAAVQA